MAVKFRDTSCIMVVAMTRSYRLQRRAERQAETRRRIIDAAIALHQTLGPARTTVSDIAERARVGRVTVYRYFGNEPALARACSSTYFQRHPLPDLEPWRHIADAHERMTLALHDTYAYHRATEAMMTRVLADARDHEVMVPYHAHWQRAADVLFAGAQVRGRRRALHRAGILLALSFDTWRLLVREQRLTDMEAITVALRLASDTSRSAETLSAARQSSSRVRVVPHRHSPPPGGLRS